MSSWRNIASGYLKSCLLSGVSRSGKADARMATNVLFFPGNSEPYLGYCTCTGNLMIRYFKRDACDRTRRQARKTTRLPLRLTAQTRKQIEPLSYDFEKTRTIFAGMPLIMWVAIGKIVPTP